MARPIFLHHPSSLEHETGEHPEQAGRMEAVMAAAREQGDAWELRESPEATREQLEFVHPRRYVLAIEESCLSGGRALDPDTVVSEGSWEAALHSAGGAVQLVDDLLTGQAPTGFSAHRPPGHHAEPMRAMGFCLFDNVAIGARHAQSAHGLERVLIVDWDVHHGNGTNDVFAEDRTVFFASLHESPLYPGTGPFGDRGRGDGAGFTLNLPIPGGSGDEVWTSLLEHVVVPAGRRFVPQLVLVSAGFDAHRDDPLATSRVTEDGFVTMTRSVRRMGWELGVPVGLVLEGGYDLGALGRSVAATMGEAARDGEPPAVDVPVDPMAERALDLLAQRGDTSLA